MFRFFRHIRQRLFQQDNVSRYLGYAVGETLLIVVGIFLALQLNNWNEGRKDRIEEKEYLNRIGNDLLGHISGMTNMLDMMAETKTALHFVDLVFEGQPIEDEHAFLKSVVKSGAFGYLTPNSPFTTYEELINSGKLQLIQSIQLRDLISGYYTKARNVFLRSEGLKGDYGILTLELIPRGEDGDLNNSLDVLTDEKAKQVIDRVLQSTLPHHITAQRNRLKYLEGQWEERLELAHELKAAIDNYIAD